MDFEKKLNGIMNKVTNKEKLLDIKKFNEINKIPENDFVKRVYRYPQQGTFKDSITIIPLSDIHLGSRQCNKKKLQMAVDLILETENCFTILMGDQTETATKISVGMGTYDEDMATEQQIAEIIRILKPLADAGKILGALDGNHEMRVRYATSINIVKMICETLGINYFGFSSYMIVHVGTQQYKIYAHHGVGGGSSAAGKLNGMRKFNKIAEADLYLSGHTHGKMHDSDIIMTIDPKSDKVVPIIRHYAVCGSFLEYWDGYAEMKALEPASTGVIAMTLSANEKKIDFLD